jgi:hypothetical protein
MNCENARRKIFLLQTGEIAGGARRELEEHLESCAACRGYREDAERILEAGRAVRSAGTPSPAALAAIRHAAEIRANAAPLRTVWLSGRLAYAAALLVAVGIGAYLLLSSGPVTRASRQTLNDRAAELAALIGLLSPSGEALAESADGAETGLGHLARQLLMLEGMTAEDPAEALGVTGSGEHEPTSLRERSSSALRPTEYG